nr:hypothetical protein [Mycobacterium tuberculosis]
MSKGMTPVAAANATKPEPAGKEMPFPEYWPEKMFFLPFILDGQQACLDCVQRNCVDQITQGNTRLHSPLKRTKTDSGMSKGMTPVAAANATKPEPAGKEMPAFEAQHEHGRGVGGTDQAEAIGPVHTHTVDGIDDQDVQARGPFHLNAPPPQRTRRA